MTRIDEPMARPALTESIVTGASDEQVRQVRRARRTRHPFRKPLSSVIRHAILIVSAFLMLYPVIWMVVSSLRPNELIFREAGIIFDSFEVSNYTDGWNALSYPFSVYLLNSGIVV